MIDRSLTLEDIFSQDRNLAAIMERLGLAPLTPDQTLEDLCLTHGRDPEFIIRILEAFDAESPFPKEALQRFSVVEIISYLSKTHDHYIRKKIPEIELSFHDLITKHAYTHPELVLLSSLFMRYKEGLETHIKGEEELLFPYILELQYASDGLLKSSPFLNNYDLHQFEHNHDHDEEVLSEIRHTIRQYTPETSLPISFRIFLIQLEHFEKDLIRHARIEDEVLMPKAVALEKHIKQR